MLNILRLAQELKIEFAFPTQTLYLEKNAPETQALIPQHDIQEKINNSEKTAINIAKNYPLT